VTEPISTATADHYVWGEICDGWHLVRTGDLSIIEERMPPGSAEQRHWHQHARQFFYVLEGELTMQFDDRATVLKTDTRFLVISQPPSHGDRQT
jgi:mannose-6-phosphate isomerase-like protein (cupin superfamily)